jgi:hypothetical protein
VLLLQGKKAAAPAAAQVDGSRIMAVNENDGGASTGIIIRREQETLRCLQRRLRRLLADTVGARGALHDRALERFALSKLHTAWAGLSRVMQQQQQEHQQKQQQQQQRTDKALSPELLLLDLMTPANNSNAAAMVACLGELLPEHTVCLHLQLPYHTYGPAAAAMSVAVAAFVGCLAKQHTLAQLELSFHSDDYGSVVRQGGVGLDRLPQLWGRAAAALHAALSVNSGLRLLVLRAYPGMFSADDVARVASCRAIAAPARRLALLAGTHARLGSGSPVRMLPREVLARVLDVAVPLAPLELRWQLPRHIIVGTSSSSDSDSNSDDSSSSGSSSSNEEEDDDGPPTPPPPGTLPADVAAAAAAAAASVYVP